jgi:MFS family permease
MEYASTHAVPTGAVARFDQGRWDMPALTQETVEAFQAHLRRLLWYRALAFSNIYTLYWTIYITAELHAPLFRALQVVSAGNLLAIFLEVPTGWFADRFGRKISLVLSSSCCIAGLCMYATATSVGAYLMVGIAIAQTGWSLMSGADKALAADYYQERYGPAYEAKFKEFTPVLTDNLSQGQAAGSLIGALLAVTLGLHATIWGQVAAYIVMLGLALRLKRAPRYERRVRNLWHLGWGLRRRRLLLAVIFSGGAISCLTGASYWLTPLYYHNIYHGRLSLGLFGVLWASYVGSMWLFRKYCRDAIVKRFGQFGSLVAVASLCSVCLVVIGLTSSVVGLVAIFSFYLARAVQQPTTDWLLLQRGLTGEEERATIASVSRLCGIGLTAVLVWTTSLIAERSGLSAGLLGMGLIFTLMAGSSLVALHKLFKQQPLTPLSEGDQT